MTSNRITQKDLENQVATINRMTGNAPQPYTKTDDGQYKANIGTYRLDYAYGGVRLVQLVSSGGGITVISTGGFGTKRDLYNWMYAFISGLSENRNHTDKY